MGSVHLIRHGQASFGSDDYDQLSPIGMQQSTALGMSWEASGWAPTAAVAGSMKRHAQTAIVEESAAAALHSGPARQVHAARLDGEPWRGDGRDLNRNLSRCPLPIRWVARARNIRGRPTVDSNEQ